MTPLLSSSRSKHYWCEPWTFLLSSWNSWKVSSSLWLGITVRHSRILTSHHRSGTFTRSCFLIRGQPVLSKVVSIVCQCKPMPHTTCWITVPGCNSSIHQLREMLLSQRSYWPVGHVSITSCPCATYYPALMNRWSVVYTWSTRDDRSSTSFPTIAMDWWTPSEKIHNCVNLYQVIQVLGARSHPTSLSFFSRPFDVVKHPVAVQLGFSDRRASDILAYGCTLVQS